MTTLANPIKEIASIGPEAGTTLLSIGTGLKSMSDALSGGWLSGDKIKNANDLAIAFGTLEPSITKLAGPQAAAVGVNFESIGKGLAAASESLKGGGFFDWFNADKKKNAEDFGSALGMLVAPISCLSAVSGKFLDVATGVKYMSEAIKLGINTGDAVKFANSLNVITNPMKNFSDAIRGGAKIQAEEIKHNVVVSAANAVSDKQDKVIEVLDRIADSMSDSSNASVNEKLVKIAELLTKIHSEMSMGGSFGNSSANSSYI
jgi:hypothetical protein